MICDEEALESHPLNVVSAFPCCPNYSFLTQQVNWWTQLVPGGMKHRKICKNS